MSLPDHTKFPSGRSISDIKKDAKRLQKKTGKKLSTCLDQLARENGGPYESWAKNLASLNKPYVERHSHPEMTMDDLLSLAKTYPEITQFGVGVSSLYIGRELSLKHKDSTETDAEIIDQIVREQRDNVWMLLGNSNKALPFIDMLVVQSGINREPKLDSYELKHIAEYAFNRLEIERYFHHGAFIFAALFRGLQPERCSPDSLSFYFNISSESPILKWDGDVNDQVARELVDRVKAVDPPKSAPI